MIRRIDMLDLETGTREMVSECEITGKRTEFTRNGRAVAVLISHDEFLAMRETIDLAANPEILRDIELAEEEAKRAALILPEDLLVE